MCVSLRTDRHWKQFLEIILCPRRALHTPNNNGKTHRLLPPLLFIVYLHSYTLRHWTQTRPLKSSEAVLRPHYQTGHPRSETDDSRRAYRAAQSGAKQPLCPAPQCRTPPAIKRSSKPNLSFHQAEVPAADVISTNSGDDTFHYTRATITNPGRIPPFL